MANVLDAIFRRDFRVDSDGTTRQISLIENVKSALQNRFSVFKGAIPFRPLYGSSLKFYQDEPMTKELENVILKEVRDQILSDTRVKELKQVRVNRNPEGIFLIQIEALLVGAEDLSRFEVVI